MRPMKLFDSHTHLQDRRLSGQSQAIVVRAKRAGVKAMLVCATAEFDWPWVSALSAQDSSLFAACGVHPWHVESLSDGWLNRLGQWLEKGAFALGEVGLDFAVQGLNRELQETVFRAQLGLARELALPLSIHCRKAWGPLVSILKKEGGLSHGGAIHSFSGSVEIAFELERLGAFFSFSGSVTRKKNLKARRAAAAISKERLLVETDTPDILCEGAQGPFSEPAHVVEVAEALARIREESMENMAEATWRNACALFQIDERQVL